MNFINAYHSQENILITKEGLACLADFGIAGIVTDPSIVPSGGVTSGKGLVCYMAPEQLDASPSGQENGSRSKESDVHSLAMTAYKVCVYSLMDKARELTHTITRFSQGNNHSLARKWTVESPFP